jgi:hypothetical protein
VAKLLEKSGQIWTQLLEDGILQELQGKEDKFQDGRGQPTMEDNFPTREYQDCRRNDEPSSRRKSGVGTKDRTIGSIGAPTRKGGTIGHGNRCSESAP